MTKNRPLSHRGKNILDFSRFPIPFSYTHPSSDNIFEKVFFLVILVAAFLVFRPQLDHERVSSRE